MCCGQEGRGADHQQLLEWALPQPRRQPLHRPLLQAHGPGQVWRPGVPTPPTLPRLLCFLADCHSLRFAGLRSMLFHKLERPRCIHVRSARCITKPAVSCLISVELCMAVKVFSRPGSDGKSAEQLQLACERDICLPCHAAADMITMPGMCCGAVQFCGG